MSSLNLKPHLTKKMFHRFSSCTGRSINKRDKSYAKAQVFVQFAHDCSLHTTPILGAAVVHNAASLVHALTASAQFAAV